MTNRISFTCPKSSHTECLAEEVRIAGKYSRFFDVQNKKFQTVSCAHCGYTEMYRGDTSTLANVFDFFTG